MIKKVEIELSKEELIEIIAYYGGVKKEDVDLLADFNGNICCIVKKELAFPDKSVSLGAYNPITCNPLVVKATTPISTATEYTGYLPGTFDSPTNISD